MVPTTANAFSTAALYGLLKPYEGAKLPPRYTFNGPNDYVDIATPGINRIGADVREVTPEGVLVARDHGPEFISFDRIERLTFRTATLYETLAKVTLYRAAEQVAA